MIHKSFKAALKYGEEGEEIISDWLVENRDVSVIPFYQFEPKKAPVLYTRGKKHILPDLFCAKKGKCFFIECKRKTRWVFYNGIAETGLNDRHLAEYKAVQNKTGIKIYPVFIMPKLENVTSGGLYLLNDIGKKGRLWNGKNRSTGATISPPIYFWRESQLIKIVSLEDL